MKLLQHQDFDLSSSSVIDSRSPLYLRRCRYFHRTVPSLRHPSVGERRAGVSPGANAKVHIHVNANPVCNCSDKSRPSFRARLLAQCLCGSSCLYFSLTSQVLVSCPYTLLFQILVFCVWGKGEGRFEAWVLLYDRVDTLRDRTFFRLYKGHRQARFIVNIETTFISCLLVLTQRFLNFSHQVPPQNILQAPPGLTLHLHFRVFSIRSCDSSFHSGRYVFNTSRAD